MDRTALQDIIFEWSDWTDQYAYVNDANHKTGHIPNTPKVYDVRKILKKQTSVPCSRKLTLHFLQ